MNYKLFLIPVIVALLFSACSVGNQTNTTPRFVQVMSPRTNLGDTLQIKKLSDLNEYVLDTICVGDTVSFTFYMDGYGNNLKIFTLTQSSDNSASIVLPRTSSLDSVFNAAYSNYKQGSFVFKPGIKGIYFPFRYVASTESDKAILYFVISSDADFQYNVASFTLKTPIASRRNAIIKE